MNEQALDTFPEGWISAAVKPAAPGWYERRYSDGTYAHHWNGSQWSATQSGNAHWRQLSDAPYPLWRAFPVGCAATPAAAAASVAPDLLREALVALEGTLNGGVAVWALGGSHQVNTAITKLREHLKDFA